MTPLQLIRASRPRSLPDFVASAAMPLVYVCAVEFGARGIEPVTLAVLFRYLLLVARNEPRLVSYVRAGRVEGTVGVGLGLIILAPAAALLALNSAGAAMAIWSAIMVLPGLFMVMQATRAAPDRTFLAARFPALSDRPDLSAPILGVQGASQVVFGLGAAALGLVAGPAIWVLYVGLGIVPLIWLQNVVVAAWLWSRLD